MAKKKVSHANRGLKFEEKIEQQCMKYLINGQAVIHKVPTEWKVLRKYNPAKKRSEIFNAFPVSESKFVDFIGISKGLPIAIEAKETKELTRFPFDNIKETQLEFFKNWNKNDGKGFYLIRFSSHDKIFLVECEKMQNCINTIGRKSAPYDWFLENTTEIEDLDFLKYII